MSVVFKSVSSGYNLLEYGDLIIHTCIISTETISIFVTYEAFEKFPIFQQHLIVEEYASHDR